MAKTLTPAYGREYKNKKEILADFAADKDFTIADMQDPYDGKPVNRPQIEEEGIKTVNVRYAGLRKIAVLNFKAGVWK